jgi:hypothetical protein
MFSTYSSAPQFEFIPELETFDREQVCYSGPDAIDGSSVVYICLERFKADHLKISNCILVRLHLIFSAAVKRPFNILVDCSGVQASSAAVVDVMKELSAMLLSSFDSAAKKRLKNLFLVHPSIDTLRSIQLFIEQTSPKLWNKVCPSVAVALIIIISLLLLLLLLLMMMIKHMSTVSGALCFLFILAEGCCCRALDHHS